VERGCYFLRAPPPEVPREPEEELRDPELDPREELPLDELPRETLPLDFPEDDEPERDPPDLTVDPLERPEEEGLATEPEDGRDKGPEYVRARPLPPSP